VRQYDGEIRYMDQHFKRLIDTLKQLGLYDNTLIIFTADHGEGMGEHDYYFAHGENLYNSLLHVPLIVKFGSYLTGRRTDHVGHFDIVPTILNMLDLKADLSYRGTDLRRGKKEREIFAEMKTPPHRGGIKFSLTGSSLKLIYTAMNNRYELFDLDRDFTEEHDLSDDGKYRKQLDDLKNRLHYLRNEDLLGLKIVNSPLELTDEEIQNLKSLGYVR